MSEIKTRAKRTFTWREREDGNLLWQAYQDLRYGKRKELRALMDVSGVKYATFIDDTSITRPLRDIASGRMAVYAAYFAPLGVDLLAAVNAEMGVGQEPETEETTDA